MNQDQMWRDKEDRTADRIGWEAAKNNAARLLAGKPLDLVLFEETANKLYQLDPQKPKYTPIPLANGVVANPPQVGSIRCEHDQPAVKRFANTAANKGRAFYCCAQDKKHQCQFFLWEDEIGKPIKKSSYQIRKTKVNAEFEPRDYIEE